MQSEASTSTGQSVEKRERSSVWMIAAPLLLLGLIGAFMIERPGTVTRNASATSDVLAATAAAGDEYQNGATDHTVIIVPDAESAGRISAGLAADATIVSATATTSTTVEVVVPREGTTVTQLQSEFDESTDLLAGTGHDLMVYEVPS